MFKIRRMKPEIISLMMILYSALFITTCVCRASFLLMLVIMAWLFVFLMSVNDLKNNIALFCFLVSFFVFLMGREICFEYLNVDEYYLYLKRENNFAFICLMISLAGIAFGCLFSKKTMLEKGINLERTYSRTAAIRNASKQMFFFCYIFKLAGLFLQIKYVVSVGYVASYSAELDGVEIPSVVSYIGAFMPMALGVFLATKPPKKKALLPLALYELYAILTIFSGKRYPFVACNLLILIYLVLRSREEKGWISRRMILLLILAAPVLIVFLTAYESIRAGFDFSFEGFSSTLVHFMDTLGGSVNVIKRVRYFDGYLDNSTLYSLNSTWTILFENLISRNLFHVVVYDGNSMEHALYGHALNHTLSFYTYGQGYLAGHGVGSCYIAELYHDFGYLGVFAGSVIYGRLLSALNRMTFSRPFRDGILFAAMYYILLAPRGGFDSFVENIFGLYSILGYAVIYIASKIRYVGAASRAPLPKLQQ